VPLTQVELSKLEGDFDNLKDIDKHIKHLQRIQALVVHLEKWDDLHRAYPHFISVDEYLKIHSLITQLGTLVVQTQDPELLQELLKSWQLSHNLSSGSRTYIHPNKERHLTYQPISGDVPSGYNTSLKNTPPILR
jgi:hypothetical protein